MPRHRTTTTRLPRALVLAAVPGLMMWLEPGLSTAAPAEGPGATMSDAPDFQLRAQSDGTYLYEEPGGGFTATIRPDGSVQFNRQAAIKDSSLELLGIDLLGRRSKGGDSVEARAQAQRQQDQLEIQELWQVLSALGPVIPLISFSTPMPGLADMLGNKKTFSYGMRKFLARTEAMRRRMAIAFQRQCMQQALQNLGPQLRRASEDTKTTLAERRELMFRLWDEMLDPLPAEPADATPAPERAPSQDAADAVAPHLQDNDARALDEYRHEMATKARRRIELFIEKNMPRGTDKGFSDEELLRFNARRQSAEPFAPYGRGSAP